MKNRVEHIDIAKGISIALVALFHSHLSWLFIDILSPMSLFRMPLFFFLSGVFFSFKPAPKEFLMKKAEALLKPYFSVLLFIFLGSVLLQTQNLTWQLFGIFYGTGSMLKILPMWFLTHLFSIYCFSYFLFRWTNFNLLTLPLQLLLLVICLCLGTSYLNTFSQMKITLFDQSNYFTGLPFSIDLLLVSTPFFILGHLLKNMIISFSGNKYLLLLSVSIFLLIASLSDAHIDLNKRIYEAQILATLGAITGIYIILSISWFLAKFKLSKNLFLILGNASLFILIFHHPIERHCYTYLTKQIEPNTILTLPAFIAFFIGLLSPLAIRLCIINNRYLRLFFLPLYPNKKSAIN